MTFVFPQDILFKHCDPAGIVFFPRYFEMINDCVEAFFGQELGCSFVDIHKFGGIPTAEISAKFSAPSRHGDRLEIRLKCTKIGNASVGLVFDAICGDELRFAAKSALVFVSKEGKPQRLPTALRAALETFRGDVVSDE
ncbi:MAG: acyl-CoA thioesterase [Rhodobacteraceae bacterium]|nr:acyl-CoA thioesterase [Paracoccaceae bacterium]